MLLLVARLIKKSSEILFPKLSEELTRYNIVISYNLF
jgi:hypothetical protein